MTSLLILVVFEIHLLPQLDVWPQTVDFLFSNTKSEIWPILILVSAHCCTFIIRGSVISRFSLGFQIKFLSPKWFHEIFYFETFTNFYHLLKYAITFTIIFSWNRIHSCLLLSRNLPKVLYMVFCKVWVAKVLAHTHTCNVRSHVCVCVRNPFWKVCGMCVRAALFWACDVWSHFCTLLHTFTHFLGTTLSENATF